jgi:hypothetical protein
VAKTDVTKCQVCDERRVIEYGTALHRRRFCLTHMPMPALRLALMGLAAEKLRQDVQMYIDVPAWLAAERRILLGITGD